MFDTSPITQNLVCESSFVRFIKPILVQIQEEKNDILKEFVNINKKVLLYQKQQRVRFVYKQESLKFLKRKLKSLKFKYDKLCKWETQELLLLYKFVKQRKLSLQELLS